MQFRSITIKLLKKGTTEWHKRTSIVNKFHHLFLVYYYAFLKIFLCVIDHLFIYSFIIIYYKNRTVYTWQTENKHKKPQQLL